MPVTARLSKLFYERFGEEIANELVEWFNSVDSTYKADLRELIEIHFARLEAKLEQRIGELSARFDIKIAEMGARFDAKLAEQNARFDAKIAEQNARFDSKISELREFVERRLGEQTRWYYIAWAVQMTAIMTVLLRLFLR